MNGFVRHLLLTLLLCAMCQHGVSQAPQQTGFSEQTRKPAPSASTFVPYTCKHKSCDDVANVLRPLLPSPNEQPGIQLVVDRDGNRLLLMGPANAHDLATNILQEVDRPTANSPLPPATDSSRSVKAYKLPARLHETVIRDLQSRFGSAVRISDDANSGNVFVSATNDLHSEIAATVAGYTGELQTTLPPQSPPIRYRETTGSVPARQVPARQVPTGDLGAGFNAATSNRADDGAQAGGAQPSVSDYPRFVRVPNGQMDRIQQQLMAIFSTRLQVRTVQGRQVFTLQTTGETPARIDIEFDRLRSGVLVDGVGPAPMQLTVLIQSLSKNAGRGRGMKVFGLRRDNHQRLRSVIESGSVNYRRREQLGRSGLPSVRRLPRFQDQQVRPAQHLDVPGLHNAAGLNSFSQRNAQRSQSRLQLAQATSPIQSGSLDGVVAPVRQFEGVDVESLPDLDVIILRGPDQDLDQLAEIIKQLERISQDTQPEIRVYPLAHAQSEAVAEIVEEVSGDLTGGRQGKVSVLPLVKPNAVLIIGWGDAVTATEELLEQLDKPIAAESQSEVFRLRFASANEVQQTLQGFFQNRGGLGPRVQLATDPATNSLIVYAAPRDIEEIRKLVSDIDQPEGKAVNRAQVFKLRNALASDVAETLLQAIQGATADGERSAALELLDADGQRVLRSGTLRNVQVTPNARNNTLIVSSPQGNLELIGALIQQLDTPSGQAKIKVFRIVNGDAASLIQTLRSLIPSQTAGATGANASQLSATGEGGLAPLRFSVDARSNSIIATGADGDLRIVEALLAKLDQTTTMRRRTAVYRLKNSPAIDIANAVNQYLLNRRQLDSAVPGQANAFAQIEREVVVVPEPIANKLILAATPRYFDEIQALVEKLDESPPQVMIQVLIAEVALNNVDEFGVELGLQDSVLFDRSLLGNLLTTQIAENTSTADGIISTTQDVVQAATNVPGFAFNSTDQLGNSGSSQALNNANQIGTQGISNFSLGRGNEQLGFGGLVLSASSKNVSILLRALRESRRVDILSRPQIRTLDNQPAYIQVGERVPRIIGSTVNQFGGQTNTVTLEDVGLILGVTPRVSPDGKVVMEIDAEKSAIGAITEGIPISSVDGNVVRSPRVETTTAQATVSAADGETIVLGGLITENSEYVHRTVPFLGNIPILEKLFRYDNQIKQRSELLIILTPHVIRSAEDNERIRQLEMARMSWCACDVHKLMDDIGYFPEQSYDHVDMGEPEVIYPDLNPTAEPQLAPPEPSSIMMDYSNSLGDPTPIPGVSEGVPVTEIHIGGGQ